MQTSAGSSTPLLNDWLRRQSDSLKAWDIGGQFRLRYELKDNAGSVPNRDFIHNEDNDNNYLLERLKYHLGWTPVSWLTTYIEGRSSFAQWDKRDPSPESDGIDLHQAFLAVGDPNRFPFILKVGRQEMLYGEERFIGVGDWSNIGRVFDAAKLRFENRAVWVDAFAGRQVFPYDGRFNEVNNDDWLSGVYASSKNLVPWQETQLYFISRNVGSGSTNFVTPTATGATPRDLYTIGTRCASLPGQLAGWDYSLEVAGQLGSINQSNVRRNQEAYALFASGGYSWKKNWGSPRLGVGYEFGSGDCNPNDGKNQTFESLYGTNHRFYGAMDLFGQRNMHIPRLCASIKPAQGLTISTEYLLFWLADTHDFLYPEVGAGRSRNGYGQNPNYDSFVGSEIDIVANYTLKSFGNLQLGYGHFFVGDYIKQSVGSLPQNGGAVDADWFYVQARFTF